MGEDGEEKTYGGVEEEVVVVVVVVIQAGHAGWGGSGALRFILLFLPSILDSRKLKRCQNEGWSLVSRQPNSEPLPPPLPHH